ncbi:hypothetical protein LCGC14_0220390 [marine sediment metagenome]|uniref:Uncharacterized protein n=1 Tax=marine sediment metagenome TaxID=412755 RepID=A0A0F9XGX2_9ZZZZ
MKVWLIITAAIWLAYGIAVFVTARGLKVGYEVYKIQNTSDWSGQKPTVIITENDPGWEEAHARWLDMKNPTDSPEWKKGVIAITKRKEGPTSG